MAMFIGTNVSLEMFCTPIPHTSQTTHQTLEKVSKHVSHQMGLNLSHTCFTPEAQQ